LLIAAAFVIGVTVLAIVALLRGESIGKTLKMWIQRELSTLSAGSVNDLACQSAFRSGLPKV